jgi:hypothetical protein
MNDDRGDCTDGVAISAGARAPFGTTVAPLIRQTNPTAGSSSSNPPTRGDTRDVHVSARTPASNVLFFVATGRF